MASPSRKTFHRIVLSCRRKRGVTRKVGEEVLRGSRRGRHEFIARDFRGNTHPAVLAGLDPHNLSQAADTYVARLRDLLRQSDDELNLAPNFELGIGEEVKPAVTDIPRVRVQFAPFGLPRQNPHGKAHRESPRFAAFRSITHQYPRAAGLGAKLTLARANCNAKIKDFCPSTRS